ncbi:hypothetical protein [Hyphomonas sp.]|jgi:hypothetical protein|uniref:hypothetical protein n=1 Tax=Hyphomonas sp. TaxID=87 RepID=UPI0032EF78D8
MAKLKIPRGIYLQHRVRADGRLLFRWGHAPGLRARGIKPLDLFADGRPLTAKDLAGHGLPASITPPHDAGASLLHTGRAEPLSMNAAIAAATQLTAALSTQPAQDHKETAGTSRPAGRHAPAAPALSVFTVGDLIAAFFSPANTRLDGRADDTARSYRSWRAPVDEVFAAEPCAQMNEDLIEDWFALQREARGHRMAYGGYQLLRRAWNWGRRRYRLHEIIWSEIEAPKPAAKLRIGTQLELTYLLRAMDDPASLLAELQLSPQDGPPARPELGDSLVLAIWTTQRAKNVLAFTERSVRSGRVRLMATKNTSPVDMPIVGAILPARLAALRARRAARGASCSHLVLDPSSDQPYAQKTHGKHFREARALAARFVPSLIGEGHDDWGRPHKAFTFEDCRDTGITRLLRAGCTIDQIVSWSNHKSAESLRALAASYLSADGEIADQVGEKLDAYVTAQGLAI